MPEGVLSMSRVLEAEAKKARDIRAGPVREPRTLYETERLHTLKQLGLNDVLNGRADVGKMKHLGRFPRGRQGRRETMAKADGGKKAREKYNAGRNKDFAEELVRLTSSIGHHLAVGDGRVPDGIWSSFDNLNTNRRFFRKAEDEVGQPTRNNVGPGSYLSSEYELPSGGRMGTGQASERGRTEAQLEAEDRMKHRESSFRTSKDYGKKEQLHLQRLFEELGRPRFSYTRGDRNYEEHLDSFAFRHVQIFHRRHFEDVKDRVHYCLRFNRFLEVGEGEYWAAVRDAKAASAPCIGLGGRLDGLLPSVPATDPTKPRPPAWALGHKIADRVPTPPPGPNEGGSEPYEYRSIGKQIDSEKPDRGTAAFARAGAAGTTLTIAEQLANLTPTSTTYRPKDSFLSTKERPRSYPWKQVQGEAMVKQGVMVGPGSYEAPSMSGVQHESTRSSHPALTVPRAWTKRLPRDLEPVKQKYGAAAPLPPIPQLKTLVP